MKNTIGFATLSLVAPEQLKTGGKKKMENTPTYTFVFWYSVVIIPLAAIAYIAKELVAGIRHGNGERDNKMIFLIEEERREK